MSNAVFPPAATGTGTGRLDWSSARSPEFKTLTEEVASGLDTAAATWAFPRWHWKLAYGSIGQAGHPQLGDMLRPIVGHFLTHRARGDTFLFRDPEDFAITNQFIGAGNGVTKNFQILRNYGGFVEPIYEIKAGTLVVKNQSGTTLTGWTESQGLVQFAVAPPGTVTQIKASCEFYFRVEFDDDSIDFENFTYLLHALREVHIKSVKR